MIIQHLPEIPADEIKVPGTSGVCAQGVLMEHPLLPGFLVRMFSLEPGGHTGLHKHPQQHLHYIVQGRCAFIGKAGVGEGERREPLEIGDVVLTEPNEWHQMVNASEDETVRFFDVVGPFQTG